MHPLEWTGFLPSFLLKLVQADIAIRGLAIYEIFLGVWLLSGRYAKYVAALSAVTFAGIVAVTMNQLIVTFRDVGLLFAALALFFLEY